MSPAPSVTALSELGAQLATRYATDRGWEVLTVAGRQALIGTSSALTLQYKVKVRKGGEPASSLLVAVECDGAIEDADQRVWAFPDDPTLPGLPAAAAGIVIDGAAAEAELLRWRPSRRAVFRYSRQGTTFAYVKAFPPQGAERLLATVSAAPHEWTTLRLARPRPTAAPGVVITAPVPGRSLRDLLVSGGRLPDPAAVVRLTEELAAVYGRHDLPRSPRGTATVSRARRAAELVGRLVPEAAPDAARVVAAVEAGRAAAPTAAGVVHGDLYENQILVDEDGTLGLIDLDDLGLGDPAQDAACCSAHLLTLAAAGVGGTAAILHYRDALRSAWLRRLDIAPGDLTWREAYSLLLLATGPFRVMHRDWPARVRARTAQAASLL